jgi:hypothetical protein
MAQMTPRHLEANVRVHFYVPNVHSLVLRMNIFACCVASWFWRPWLWLEKGFAFANSQLFLNVREIQSKPPLVLTSHTTLKPSTAINAWPHISEHNVGRNIWVPLVYIFPWIANWLTILISTNRCTILYFMYFTISLLLHVSAQFPSLGNLTNFVTTYNNK